MLFKQPHQGTKRGNPHLSSRGCVGWAAVAHSCMQAMWAPRSSHPGCRETRGTYRRETLGAHGTLGGSAARAGAPPVAAHPLAGELCRAGQGC